MIGNVLEQDLENEIRAVEKLCSLDGGNLLVEVFHHEEGSSGLFAHDLHQIDMELCIKSLRDEINNPVISIGETLTQLATTGKEIAEYQKLSLLLLSGLLEIVRILSQILEGLEFIHS